MFSQVESWFGNALTFPTNLLAQRLGNYNQKITENMKNPNLLNLKLIKYTRSTI